MVVAELQVVVLLFFIVLAGSGEAKLEQRARRVARRNYHTE